METFVHEYVSPINRYKAVSVRHGLNTYPVVSYEGRLCYVTNTVRTRRKAGWGFFNVAVVHFLDGTNDMIPVGKFSKAAKNVPLPAEA